MLRKDKLNKSADRLDKQASEESCWESATLSALSDEDVQNAESEEEAAE